MKSLTRLFLASLFCAASLPACADTLHFVSTGGDVSGGYEIYPYNFSVDNSSSLTSLMCIDFANHVTVGEQWQVNATAIPTDNSSLSSALRADALLFSAIGTTGYSTADLQFAAWSILDPSDVAATGAESSTAKSLANLAMSYADNSSLINSGFFSRFTLYVPTADGTGWTDGTPQRFIGLAPTPEPTTLLLLASGLLGLAYVQRKRFLSAYASRD